MTLGQTFYGFASILRNEIKHLNEAAADFLVVNMGSTAIGTGICSEPGYAEKTIEALKEITGWEVSLADDWVGATSDTSCMVGYMSALKRVAVKINKICNDLRLLASGPRCGFGEINLPARQPGSSIMPGKVNPVGAEFIQQIYYKICGNDLTLTMACGEGELELNAMHPVIAEVFLESFELLRDGVRIFREKVVKKIQGNIESCTKHLENSITKASVYIEKYGYNKLAELIKESQRTGKKIEDLMEE
jgi:aspartate ammonia-lyase